MLGKHFPCCVRLVFLHSRVQVILCRQQVRVAETLLICGWIWRFRFAKRKLDEYQFLGNLLQVSYAPNHETLADTRNKLEERQRTVLNRLKCNSRSEQQPQWQPQGPRDPLLSASWQDNRSAEQPPPSALEQLYPAVQGRGVVEIKTATAISSYPQNATIQMNPHEVRVVLSAAFDPILRLTYVHKKINK
jgi:hypothetical protein